MYSQGDANDRFKKIIKKKKHIGFYFVCVGTLHASVINDQRGFLNRM